MDEDAAGQNVKTRKPYTITKQRERWTDEEHNKFLEALRLYGRAWRRIEEHIGTKTAVQIRSHAQKFFTKLERQKESGGPEETPFIDIPPPRPKRKPSKPYPRKDPTGGSHLNHTSSRHQHSNRHDGYSDGYDGNTEDEETGNGAGTSHQHHRNREETSENAGPVPHSQLHHRHKTLFDKNEGTAQWNTAFASSGMPFTSAGSGGVWHTVGQAQAAASALQSVPSVPSRMVHKGGMHKNTNADLDVQHTSSSWPQHQGSMHLHHHGRQPSTTLSMNATGNDEDADGEVSEATIAAVAAAASAAAAAAAAAVIAAAGQQVQAHLQHNPPKGFPFFGHPPPLLANLSLNGSHTFEELQDAGLTQQMLPLGVLGPIGQPLGLHPAASHSMRNHWTPGAMKQDENGQAGQEEARETVATNMDSTQPTDTHMGLPSQLYSSQGRQHPPYPMFGYGSTPSGVVLLGPSCRLGSMYMGPGGNLPMSTAPSRRSDEYANGPDRNQAAADDTLHKGSSDEVSACTAESRSDASDDEQGGHANSRLRAMQKPNGISGGNVNNHSKPAARPSSSHHPVTSSRKYWTAGHAGSKPTTNTNALEDAASVQVLRPQPRKHALNNSLGPQGAQQADDRSNSGQHTNGLQSTAKRGSSVWSKPMDWNQSRWQERSNGDVTKRYNASSQLAQMDNSGGDDEQGLTAVPDRSSSADKGDTMEPSHGRTTAGAHEHSPQHNANDPEGTSDRSTSAARHSGSHVKRGNPSHQPNMHEVSKQHCEEKLDLLPGNGSGDGSGNSNVLHDSPGNKDNNRSGHSAGLQASRANGSGGFGSDGSGGSGGVQESRDNGQGSGGSAGQQGSRAHDDTSMHGSDKATAHALRAEAPREISHDVENALDGNGNGSDGNNGSNNGGSNGSNENGTNGSDDGGNGNGSDGTNKGHSIKGSNNQGNGSSANCTSRNNHKNNGSSGRGSHLYHRQHHAADNNRHPSPHHHNDQSNASSRPLPTEKYGMSDWRGANPRSNEPQGMAWENGVSHMNVSHAQWLSASMEQGGWLPNGFVPPAMMKMDMQHMQMDHTGGDASGGVPTSDVQNISPGSLPTPAGLQPIAPLSVNPPGHNGYSLASPLGLSSVTSGQQLNRMPGGGVPDLQLQALISALAAQSSSYVAYKLHMNSPLALHQQRQSQSGLNTSLPTLGDSNAYAANQQQLQEGMASLGVWQQELASSQNLMLAGAGLPGMPAALDLSAANHSNPSNFTVGLLQALQGKAYKNQMAATAVQAAAMPSELQAATSNGNVVSGDALNTWGHTRVGSKGSHGDSEKRPFGDTQLCSSDNKHPMSDDPAAYQHTSLADQQPAAKRQCTQSQ